MTIKHRLPAAAIVLALTLTASAQDQTPQPGNSRMIRRIERRLNVSEPQRQQLKSILAQERPALQQLHAQLAAERAELARQTTFDEAQTRAIALKYADTNTAAIVERERLRTELLAVLTPAQRQRVQQLRSRFTNIVDARLQTLGDTL